MIVHFPIALLAVAPVLLLIGMLGRTHRPWMAAGLVVMAAGTLGAWLAAASGGAAAHLAEDAPGIAGLLEQHEEMAENARTVFTVLTLAFGALLILPWALRREPAGPLRLVVHGGFLILYAAAYVYLANAAHQGARLVHEMGVHAQITTLPIAIPAPAHGPPPARSEGGSDD
jgi:uncharacterized membrane protein